MPADHRERTIASAPEATFASGPATDWDTDGTVFWCIDPSVEALRRSMHENLNYRQRALASKAHLLGVQTGMVSFGMYATGSGVATAAAANAATYQLADMLRNAWGGRRLTRANALQTSSATAPEVSVGEGSEYEPGDLIVGVAASGRAYILVVDSIASDTLTLRYDAPEVITSIAGSVQCYPNNAAMTNRDHADHVTHAFFAMGEDDEDNYSSLGVKLNVTSVDNLVADAQSVIQFEGMAADYQHQELVRPALSTAPVGGLPQTVATGNGTFVRIASVGADFGNDSNDYAYSVTPTPGVTSQPVGAVGGTNGRVGYHVDSIDDSMIEVAVEYSDAWLAAFEAGTEYHLLVQVGTVRQDLYGWYCPRLAFAEEPQRSESAGETSMVLRFRMLEHDAASAASGNELEKFRAKFHFVGGA